MLDDKPLAGATVSFVPVGPGQPASGLSDQEGSFRLGRLKPDDGLVPGSYKVVVKKTAFVPRPESPRIPSPSGQKGGGRADPGAMARAAQQLAQEQRKAKEIPAIYGSAAKTPLQIDVPKEGDKDVQLKLVSNPKGN